MSTVTIQLGKSWKNCGKGFWKQLFRYAGRRIVLMISFGFAGQCGNQVGGELFSCMAKERPREFFREGD
eukprot:398812-Amorphochlora_amoeboformis.AAC.3